MSRHNREDVGKPNAPRHTSQVSQASALSGLANSTVSNADSFRFFDYPFPRPPPSLPASPARANFTPSMLEGSGQSHHLPLATPLAPVRKLPPVPGSTVAAHESGPAPSLQSVSVSPHDWHEGASSLDVDAAEDRLLPTSFITSLLRQNSGPRIGRRASSNSDAVSRISEITYPPINVPSSSRSPPHHIVPEQKPHGARPPPTSYILRREVPGRPPRRDVPSYHTITSDSHTYVFPDTSNPEKSTAPAASAVPLNTWSNDLGQGLGGKSTNRLDNLPPINKRRLSIASTRTAASSIISKLTSSHKSLKRAITKSRKPLPPVPLIPDIPIAEEIERRKAEEATPLPELLERAEALQGLLERGYHPHHSLTSYYQLSKSRELAPSPDHRFTIHDSSINQQTRSGANHGGKWHGRSLAPRGKLISTAWQRTLVALLILIIVLVAVLVGIFVGRKTKHHSCGGSKTGANCDLDSSCVCTSATPHICQGVAKSVIELIPYLNAQFMLNISNADVYNNFWQTQLSSLSGNCIDQALAIDVGPTLNSQTSPNRTQWARTAILWNLIESQDVSASKQLQNFVQNAPWNEVEGNSSPGAFTTNVSGFNFNFASQTVTSPPQTFSGIGRPSQDQDSRVNSVARSALDYIYGNAVASSTQHHTALKTLWVSTLQRRTSELDTFITAFSNSPIILPFDANSSTVSSLLSERPTTVLFPPPLACYPELGETSINMLNAVEHGIFHLPNASLQANFSPDCYPDHPVYGILDVLRLRLPPPGFPRQAISLQSAAAPRAIVYNGELLSSVSAISNDTTLTPAQQNPTRFGTLNHFEHVILDYLNAMEPSLANAVVDFLLNSSNNTYPVPPTPTSFLSSSLDDIPLVEVAVFGSVESSDVQWVESSFTLDSDSLFFGSGRGSILRQWTVAGINSTLVWAQNATAPEVVRDKDLNDKHLNDIWNASSLAIAQKVPNAVNNLTQSLAAYGYFSS